MTIGLIVLGVLAVLLFFGAAEKYFERLGLTSWLSFLLILALIIGAVMPEIDGGAFVMTVGGFIVPLIVMTVLFVFAAKSGDGLRAVLSALCVTAVTTLFRLLFGVDTFAAVLTSSLLIGFVGGAVAYLCAGSRVGLLAGAMGGCILGDVLSASLLRGLFGLETYTLGGYGIFDALVVASVSGLLFCEVVEIVRRALANKRTAEVSLNMEASEDVPADRLRDNAEFAHDVMFDTSEAEARDLMDALAETDDDDKKE